MVKDKQLLDQRAARGGEPSTTTESSNNTMTESEESSFATSYGDQSSYDNQVPCNNAGGLMHPSDMILEQSNDDDESFTAQRPARGVQLLDIDENTSMSLLENEYVIVDPITESFRQSSSRSKRSFFDENLLVSDKNLLTSAQRNVTRETSSPEVNVHVSQLEGLTESSEDEEELDNQEGGAHFEIEDLVVLEEDRAADQ